MNQQWEYLVISTIIDFDHINPNEEDLQKILNDHGNEGWELVALHEDRRFILKRLITKTSVFPEAAVFQKLASILNG